MMRAIYMLLAPTMLAAPAASVVAQDRSDPYSHNAIERGEFGEAEGSLRAQLALDPTKPELLLNLAAIYARTNRVEQAQELYQRVLSTDDVSLLLRPEVALGSHAIAQRGLRKLDTQRMARR